MLGVILALSLASAGPVDLGHVHGPRKGEVAANRILSLRPGLTKKEAWRLGWLVEHYATKNDLDPILLVAILKQESNFRSGIKACWDVVRDGVPAITCDYGIAQINEVWISTWKLDMCRLRTDDSYNISVAARLLKRLRDQYGDQEQNWYGRYNSASPGPRAAYEARLETFLASTE